MNMDPQGISPAPRLNPFRELWAVTEHRQNLTSTSDSERNTVQGLSLIWILGGTGIILILVVSLVAWFAIRRSEHAMSNLLAEKGSSLLMAFEGALKTGMRGQTGLQLQALLEEITNSPDIEFVVLTMPDGTIISHSDRNMIGETFHLDDMIMNREEMKKLAPGPEEKWYMTKFDGRRIFLVYRTFTLGRKDWDSNVPKPVIFLGLDVSPFEITSSQNRSYITMLSVVTMLVGLACLLAISYAQRAAESRRRQKAAEGKVHRLEEEVRRNEKLVAIGTLAAGVAHEIRNPLSSIKGYATYFRERFPEGSDDREAAAVMVNEVNRLNRVITDLLGLSRPSQVNLRPVYLENVVAHVVRLIRQDAARRNVEIKCHIARRVPDVVADMERLSQALLNLCLNALEAMPEGGQLEIAVSGGKRRVWLIVRDSGNGISKEVMPKIFDPYFTTKRTGTGLGLPMVHKIIKAHSGEIDVVSRAPAFDADGKKTAPGMTVFRICLPVAKENGA